MRLKLLTLMTAGLAAAAFGTAQPARGGAGACALSLPAEADNMSFDDAGRASGPARARLVQATGANFAAAASHLCASGVVRVANLRPYRRLLVRNAEGATEPKV